MLRPFIVDCLNIPAPLVAATVVSRENRDVLSLCVLIPAPVAVGLKELVVVTLAVPFCDSTTVVPLTNSDRMSLAENVPVVVLPRCVKLPALFSKTLKPTPVVHAPSRYEFVADARQITPISVDTVVRVALTVKLKTFVSRYATA